MTFTETQTFTHYSAQAINVRVAEILSKLKKGHTRSEAFKAINEANIVDTRGKRIIPSVWYHALCYVPRASGKTYMEDHYPKFVPTESPYPRPKMERAPVPSKVSNSALSSYAIEPGITEALRSIATALSDLKGIVDEMRNDRNHLVEAVDNLKQEMVEVMERMIPVPKPNVNSKPKSPPKKDTSKQTETIPKTSEQKEPEVKKDNAIHASIHESDKSIGDPEPKNTRRAA